MNDSFYHYGVKGMKWGVRKEYVPHPRKLIPKRNPALTQKKKEYNEKLYRGNRNKSNYERNKKIAKALLVTAGALVVGGVAYNTYRLAGRKYFDTVIKAGQEFQRLTINPNEELNRLYASYGKLDNLKYKGWYGSPLTGGGKDAFTRKFSFSDAIKAPSDKKAEAIMDQLKLKDKDFAIFVNNLYRKHGGMVNGKKATPYEILNVFGANSVDDSAMDEMSKFYEAIKKSGYNAITDVMDRKFIGYNAKNPVIILDSAKIVSETVDKLSKEEVADSLAKLDAIKAGKVAIPALLASSGVSVYSYNELSNGKNRKEKITKVRHSDDICHYGVKGMKWGVRKEYVPHPRQAAVKASNSVKTKGRSSVTSFITKAKQTAAYDYYRVNGKKYLDTIISEGTSFQRVTVNKDEKLDRMYAVYKSEDKNLYKGRLGQLRKMQTGDPVYVKNFTAKKLVKAPSDKKSEAFMRELMDRDKEFADYVFSLKDSGFSRVSKNPKNDYDLYKNFNLAGIMDQSENGMKQAQKYYKLLKKNGYNAITDLNDRKYSTFKADNPVILFDMKNFVESSVREISNKEIAKSLSIEQLRRTGGPFTIAALKMAEKEYGGTMNHSEEFAHYGVKGMKWGIRKEYVAHPREKKPHPSKWGIGSDRRTLTTKFGETITLQDHPDGILSKFLSSVSKNVRRERDKTAIFDIKDKDGKKVGDVQLYKESQTSINVVWIGTNKSARGKGYASAVMKATIQIAKDLGCKSVTLEVPGNSPDARHIYEKLGFKEVASPNRDADDMWGGLTNMRLDLETVKHSDVGSSFIEEVGDAFMKYLLEELNKEDGEDLYHYGVKGMKWGVRKKREGSILQKFKREKTGSKAYKRGDSHKLTDEELQNRIGRLKLEKEYKNLYREVRGPRDPTQNVLRNTGSQFVNQAILGATAAVVAEKVTKPYIEKLIQKLQTP